MEGCHDQIDHLGKERTLELLSDIFYWPDMQDDVISYINSCLRYLRRKIEHNIVPLANIGTTQLLKLVHLD